MRDMSGQNQEILRVETEVSDIEKFINTRLAPACVGEPQPLINAAFITVVLRSMGPEDMTWDELAGGLEGMSSWACAYLSSLRDTSLPN